MYHSGGYCFYTSASVNCLRSFAKTATSFRLLSTLEVVKSTKERRQELWCHNIFAPVTNKNIMQHTSAFINKRRWVNTSCSFQKLKHKFMAYRSKEKKRAIYQTNLREITLFARNCNLMLFHTMYMLECHMMYFKCMDGRGFIGLSSRRFPDFPISESQNQFPEI